MKTYFSKINIAFVIISFFTFTSCYTKKDVVYFQNAKDFETIVDTDTFRAKLKVGDVLSINISTLNLEVTKPYNLVETTDGEGGGQLIDYLIDSDGNIDYPVLGKVKMIGLTVEEAKQLLKKKFEDGGLLKDPVVIIRIKNYRISILGWVAQPGVYPITGERISILEAIAMAGDLQINGKRKDVTVIRDFNGTKTYTRIDLTSKEVFKSPVYYLTQNDIVYIHPNRGAISAASGDSRIGLISSLASIALSVALIFTR
ncbi:polysaccharide biosynthesis/export family protein [Seonamhaeicola sp. ML3]|uniref:polysaccharide biosynthesis/export family protein n=1 Tax=Seonamhaeicola sp. ML3 TaxID=2937786 RepID=UPI00200C9814|nr:polysaccharide biosynthesis/export family protein [Seonamhaeicola sp. ML3]